MAKAKFTPEYRRLCELLVRTRESASLRQADVAKSLGKPQSYVSKVEQGERRLDVIEFLEFARAIGERMFCKLKNWRRIATRYDRHAQNYLSGLALAAIVCQWI